MRVTAVAAGSLAAGLRDGRAGRLWGRASTRLRDRGRVELLEARVEHLESALEGLQDAVYRRALHEDKQIDDLRRRTEPGQIARDLSRDARQRRL